MGYPNTKAVSRRMQMYISRNIDITCEALVINAPFQRLPIQFKDVSNADNIWVKTVCSSMMKLVYIESAINVKLE